MPTKARRKSVIDNESNNDLIQCTETGPDGKDRVAWTSIWLSKRIPKLNGSHFFVVFALHWGRKRAKQRNHQITPNFRVHFIQIQINSMVDVTSAFLG